MTFSKESEPDNFWIRCPKLNRINTWIFILAEPWSPSAETSILKFLPESMFCNLWRSWRDYFSPSRANSCRGRSLLQRILSQQPTCFCWEMNSFATNKIWCSQLSICGSTGFNGALLTQKWDNVVQISPVLKVSVSFYQHSFSYYSLPSHN